MKPWLKGFLLAVLHVAIILSLGAKLRYDRATRPRVWTRTVVYDPDSPLRGRYLSLRVEVDASRVFGQEPVDSTREFDPWREMRPATLAVVDSKLVALPAENGTHLSVTRWNTAQGVVQLLQEPVEFYIPEHAIDPSRRSRGEELWVEVTVPQKGRPRPIQLGVMKDGKLAPLDLR